MPRRPESSTNADIRSPASSQTDLTLPSNWPIQNVFNAFPATIPDEVLPVEPLPNLHATVVELQKLRRKMSNLSRVAGEKYDALKTLAEAHDDMQLKDIVKQISEQINPMNTEYLRLTEAVKDETKELNYFITNLKLPDTPQVMRANHLLVKARQRTIYLRLNQVIKNRFVTFQRNIHDASRHHGKLISAHISSANRLFSANRAYIELFDAA